MECRFEDRSTGHARVLSGLHERIVATSAASLAPALARIAEAQAAGYWVALLLDYELGEWLEPAVVGSKADRVGAHLGAGFDAQPDQERGSRSDTSLRAGTHTDQANAPSETPRLTALVFTHMHDTDIWPGRPDTDAGIVSVDPRVTQADYVTAIDEIRRLIREGDVYQINYTLPLDVKTRGTPEDIYARLAAQQTASHSAFIDDRAEGGRAVLSFSPELFVRRRGTRIESRPMKGTAPRSANPAEDHQLGQALLASEKNRSENVMIVDLIRNDLGRIAKPGSVQVDALFTLEQYPQVWTLTSTISAELADTSLSGMLHALFPCGSITGAPKVAAMQHIKRLEPSPRGLYCGGLGWLAPNGDFDLSVTIRTLVLGTDGTGVYGVGGGIVYDSDPLDEWEECLWKARVLTR
ncbi:aminodeoxychorismate synthase component I [Pigmentiphaga aceris]|uniref:Aminodeoxychorismate synthase component I n=1 Tax=Pigmentiphaga aceris TaxID=1940612 RepID=A0A5C0ASQ2_9BURK|nr:aminodeoxychorismate synthase component I [Pigmentiphaga aceris]QEI05309.1 aminodeoxychorismate synthase component I [Pigmentiphaga aceris]